MSDTATRDQLALDRTRLANERTLLAYVRTALSLLAGGAVILHFFPDYPQAVPMGWALLLTGAACLVLGTWRFFSVRRHLRG
jgi:putative membrane protein